MKERSKLLAYILRHSPESVGVSIRPGGWVSVAELTEKSDFTVDELTSIVASDEKGRYQIKDNLIRAVQGHSIRIPMDYAEYTVTGPLYHGTASRFLSSIKDQGINKMSRDYVHLSKDPDTARIVGGRHGRPVVISVDAVRMANDGYKFLVAENGVVLVDHVPAKYLTIYWCYNE